MTNDDCAFHVPLSQQELAGMFVATEKLQYPDAYADLLEAILVDCPKCTPGGGMVNARDDKEGTDVRREEGLHEGKG